MRQFKPFIIFIYTKLSIITTTMPLQTKRCKELIRNYKTACNSMESDKDEAQSHTKFLSNLLIISKQDIELSDEVVRAFRTLMYHVRKCSEGRIKYADECLNEKELDVGHAIEIERVNEIFVEMQKTFSRMKQRLDESEKTSRVDELVTDQEMKSNRFDVLQEDDSDDPGDEKSASTNTEEEPVRVDDTDKKARVERQNKRNLHLDNIRKLKEQICLSQEAKIQDVIDHVSRFGTVFSQNMIVTTVKDQGKDVSVISFPFFARLNFTLDQMENILMYSKLREDIFFSFMSMTHRIKVTESLSGVTTADCVKTFERISTKNYLLEILRCPDMEHVLHRILITDSRDSVLENLDHLARVNPPLFSTLNSRSSTDQIELNKDKNVTMMKNDLFTLAENTQPDFQFIVEKVSTAWKNQVEKKGKPLLGTSFYKIFDISANAALAIIQAGATRGEMTIPIDMPNQMCLDVVLIDRFVHHVTISCYLSKHDKAIHVPARYQSMIEQSDRVYVPGISATFLLQEPRSKSTYLYENNKEVFRNVQCVRVGSKDKYTTFNFTYE